MGKRIVVLLSIFTAFLLMTIPNISAIQFQQNKNSQLEKYDKPLNEFLEIFNINENNDYDIQNLIQYNSDLGYSTTPFIFFSLFIFMLMFSYRIAQILVTIGLLTLFSIWYELINNID